MDQMRLEIRSLEPEDENETEECALRWSVLRCKRWVSQGVGGYDVHDVTLVCTKCIRPTNSLVAMLLNGILFVFTINQHQLAVSSRCS